MSSHSDADVADLPAAPRFFARSSRLCGTPRGVLIAAWLDRSGSRVADVVSQLSAYGYLTRAGVVHAEVICRGTVAGQASLILLRRERAGEPKFGLAEARNDAAMKATGEWLCFLDADDELGPGYVDAMKRAMLDYRPWALFVPAVQYVEVVREVEIADGETGLITKSEQPRVLNDGRPLYVVNRAVIGTLVPRELFLAVGGFRGDLTIYAPTSCERTASRASAGRRTVRRKCVCGQARQT